MSTLLTSSPSSYDWKIPSKWLSPPCSICTGHTAPRCTPCTQRWPPAAAPPARSPPHQPPPSWRPVVRPACCHNYPPPPLLRSHVTYRRMPAGASLQEMCTRWRPEADWASHGSATCAHSSSTLRACTVRAHFLILLRAQHCKAHSLSPPTNPSSPSPFNLFPFASFVSPPKLF